ncbi:MAG: exodeoxyribonuclease III [Desulfobulbaceae bacterium]|nr:exodeoxyribonuclease III [Desulfobulbaceae bacterium]
MDFEIEQAIETVSRVVQTYHTPVVDLMAVQGESPFRILVATILSARTKDEVTAAACKRLFKRAADPISLAALSREELEKIIFPVGFYHNKAKYLAQLPGVLMERFNGEVPGRMEDLLTLPGVGRKTANLVLALAFKVPAICVDTHVHRIMNIWGYVTTTMPLQTEMALREKLPQKYWLTINGILVAFGQHTCKPVAPRCGRCALSESCPKIGVPTREKKEASLRNGIKKFVSWNVNGLRAIHKKGFLDIVARFDADIFALQEIKAQEEQLPPELVSVPGYQAYFHSAERKGYSGVAVYAKKQPLAVYYGMGEKRFDSEGRVLTLEYDDYFFVNSYFPNAQDGLSRIDFKIAFNNRMLQYIEELSKIKSVVLCGDFNVAHTPIDLANPEANKDNAGFSPPERAWVDEIIAKGYVDSFRRFCTEPNKYTWWSYRFRAREKNIGWRIDYFLLDSKSESRLVEATIHDDVMGSDHCPVSIGFV